MRDGVEPQFYEPGGLSGANARLYVADTNNHAIRVVDLAMQSVSTLELKDPEGLLIGRGTEVEAERLSEQRVKPGRGSVLVDVKLPPGHKVNEDAPSYISWKSQDRNVVTLPDEALHVPLAGQTFPVRLPATFHEGHTTLLAEFSLYYCKTDGANLCLLEFSDLEIPVTVTEDAPSQDVRLDLQIQAPEE